MNKILTAALSAIIATLPLVQCQGSEYTTHTTVQTSTDGIHWTDLDVYPDSQAPEPEGLEIMTFDTQADFDAWQTVQNYNYSSRIMTVSSPLAVSSTQFFRVSDTVTLGGSGAATAGPAAVFQCLAIAAVIVIVAGVAVYIVWKANQCMNGPRCSTCSRKLNGSVTCPSCGSHQ